MCTSGKCGLPANGRTLGSQCSTSAQCQSGYCGRSTCREPAQFGAYCYKDVGCVSKQCDKVKNKCSRAAVTATSATTGRTTTARATATTRSATAATTATTAAAPSATTFAVGTPPASSTPIPNNGDFSDGQLAPFAASSAGSGSSAAVEKINGNYVAALKIGPGGSVSLTRPINSPAHTKRQATPARWFLTGSAAVSELIKDPSADSEAACRVLVTIGGVTKQLADFVYAYAQEGAYQGWTSLRYRWPTGPTEAKITTQCDAGLSAKILIDNVNIGPFLHTYPAYTLNDGDFESGTLQSPWYVTSYDFSSGKNNAVVASDASRAQHGSDYLEFNSDYGFVAAIYELDKNPPMYDESAEDDPGRQNLTWTYWYNIINVEATDQDASIRDGCIFTSDAGRQSHFMGTTKAGSNAMQVNDPQLTLPSGWQKGSIDIPLDYGSFQLYLQCFNGVKATVRVDNISLFVPKNETAN